MVDKVASYVSRGVALVVATAVLVSAAWGRQNDPLGQGLVTIGVVSGGAGNGFVNYDPTDPNVDSGHEVLALAAQELASQAAVHGTSGGEIRFLAGTYDFDEPFVLTDEGLTIRGRSGVVLRAASASTHSVGVLDVQASDVQIKDVVFEKQSFPAGVSQSTVRVMTPFGQGCTTARLSIRGCTFRVTATEPPSASERFAFVDVEDGCSVNFECRLIGNFFVFGPPPASPSAPPDVVGAYFGQVRGVLVVDNSFTGAGNERGYAGRALELVGCRDGAVCGNIFKNLGAEGAEMPAVVRAVYAGPTPQLVAAAITGNTVLDCAADTAVELAGKSFTFNGNTLRADGGRTAVRARDGQGLVLVDNRFEGFGLFLDVQNQFSAVELDEMDAVLIGANTFAEAAHTQVSSWSCEAVQIFSNQLLATDSATGAPGVTAISLVGGQDHHVLANRVKGTAVGATGLWTSPYWTITAGDHQVSAEDFAD